MWDQSSAEWYRHLKAVFVQNVHFYHATPARKWTSGCITDAWTRLDQSESLCLFHTHDIKELAAQWEKVYTAYSGQCGFTVCHAALPSPLLLSPALSHIIIYFIVSLSHVAVSSYLVPFWCFTLSSSFVDGLSFSPSVAVARRSQHTRLCGGTTMPSMRSSYHPPCLMSTCPTWWWRAWTRSVWSECMQMDLVVVVGEGGCFEMVVKPCSWFPAVDNWIDGWRACVNRLELQKFRHIHEYF